MKENVVGFFIGLIMVLTILGILFGPFIWGIFFSGPFEAPPCPGYGEPNFVHGLFVLYFKDSREDIMNRLERAGWENVTLHESGSYITAYCPQEIEGGKTDG